MSDKDLGIEEVETTDAPDFCFAALCLGAAAGLILCIIFDGGK